MKTTLDLPDDLMRAAKVRAAQENVKLKDLVADALREALARTAAKGEPLDPVRVLQSRLVFREDGSVFNPAGIDDEAFFAAVDGVRSASRVLPVRDPFEDR